MKIETIANKKVISIGPDEKISRALSLMDSNKMHQLPVLENGKLCGLMVLKDIIMEDVDPSTALVKHMAKGSPCLKAGINEIEAAKMILGSGLRALPVCESERVIGMLSETDIVSLVRSDKAAADIMNVPLCLNQNDTLGKAKQLFRENNISRVPVIDDREMLVGALDTLDLIKTMKPNERQSLNKSGEGEKLRASKIPIKEIMRTTDSLKSNSSVREIAAVLKTQEEVIITENGKPVGIISPKDVIELLLAESSDTRIQISHVDRDDEITKKTIYDAMEKWLKKSENDINSVFIYVHRHSKGSAKYSLRARIMTSRGILPVKSFGPNAMACALEITKNADRILRRDQETRERRLEKKRRISKLV